MMISVFDRVENIVEKRENNYYQHFLLFSRGFFFRVVKSWDSVVKSNVMKFVYEWEKKF